MTRTPPIFVARAALCGIGGALAGAALYGVVLAATHAMISYIAIAVAYFVGRAMQFGSGGRRGLPFQIVAVALTYCGIALGYAFTARDALATMQPVQVVTFVLSLPVLETTARLPYSLLTGIIVAIGLWYAWVMNRPIKLGARA